MRVEGISQLLRGLRAIDRELPKQLQREYKAHAQSAVPLVRAAYSARYTTRTGRGAGSIRAVATERGGGVRIGGARAVYMPGQEFGSNRKKQFAPRVPGGRFLNPTVRRLAPAARKRELEALDRALAQAYPQRGRH